MQLDRTDSCDDKITVVAQELLCNMHPRLNHLLDWDK